MALSFAKQSDIPRGRTAAAFVMAAAVSMTPFQALATNKPGPHTDQKARISGAAATVGTAIRGAFAQREQAIRRYGLAGHMRGNVSNLFNPAKDGMTMAVAAVVPAFAPVAMIVTGLNVKSYWDAERESGTDYGRDFGYFARTSEGLRQTEWNQTGYMTLTPVNDESGLSDEEIELLLMPPVMHPEMRVLFGQESGIEAANTNIEIREDKGLPRNFLTWEAAQEQDNTGWAYTQSAPAPHFL